MVTKLGLLCSRNILSFDGLIDRGALCFAPDIDKCFQMRALNRCPHQLLHEDVVGIVSSRFVGVHVLGFHMLVGQPTFDLLLRTRLSLVKQTKDHM